MKLKANITICVTVSGNDIGGEYCTIYARYKPLPNNEHLPIFQLLNVRGMMTYSPGSNIALQPTKHRSCRGLWVMRLPTATCALFTSRKTRIHRSRGDLPWSSTPLLEQINFAKSKKFSGYPVTHLITVVLSIAYYFLSVSTKSKSMLYQTLKHN